MKNYIDVTNDKLTYVNIRQIISFHPIEDGKRTGFVLLSNTNETCVSEVSFDEFIRRLEDAM